MLAAYTAGTEAAGRIAEVVEKVPDTCGVGDLAVIGRRLAEGEDPAEIREELSHDPARHVRDWLSQEVRTDEEIQLIVTLCFAAGQSQRIFEAMRSRLESTLRCGGLLPDPEDEKEDTDASDRDRAAPRPRGLSASRTRRHPNELMERKDGRVHFRGKDSSYQSMTHRHALQELWAEYDMTFWVAVRDWLTELIGDTAIHDVQVSVALGLTVLAFTALDEVEDSYLHPWASGQQAWSGQCTAVYVLWLMSRDDTLAPIALRIATSWVNSGDPARQWTAAAALSGELGVVYPAEAASRLWHLVGQWKDVPTKAVVAMAGLFATLARDAEGQDAYRVLELLRERLDRARCRNEEDAGAPGRFDERLGDPGEIGLVERFGKELGNLGQAALAVESVDGVAEARLERGGRAGVERAGVGECEDEPLAGDAEPTGGAVEAEQDDLFGERFKLRRDGRNWARVHGLAGWRGT